MPFLPPAPSGLFFAVPILVMLVFAIVIAGIVYTVGRVIFSTVRNLGEPELTRTARIVGKRQDVSVSGGMNDTPASSTTWHYVTFEFDDGSREEFSVSGHEYGLLAEGDVGTLRSQGTWYRGFTRGGSRAFESQY